MTESSDKPASNTGCVLGIIAFILLVVFWLWQAAFDPNFKADDERDQPAQYIPFQGR